MCSRILSVTLKAISETKNRAGLHLGVHAQMMCLHGNGEFNRETRISFIHYVKAFHEVNRETLCAI